MPDAVTTLSILGAYSRGEINLAQASFLLIAQGYSSVEVKKMLDDVDSQKEKPNDKQ